MPAISQSNVNALLVTGSFFDVTPLCGLVSDYVFSHLSHENVVDYLLLVHNREYGEPGKVWDEKPNASLNRFTSNFFAAH
jgi:hypothetical protein